MSVNLLPEGEERRSLQQQTILIGGGALLILWLVLGVLLLSRLTTVDQRLAERDDTAQRVEVVRAEVVSLSVFQQMADDAAAGNALLAHAMGDEVSWAQLLLDLSRGVPESASFTDIAGQIIDAPTAQDVFVQTAAADIGFFAVNGYTTELFTPGVEEMLRRFGQIDGLFQQYLSSANIDEIGDVDVTRFAAEIRLDDTSRTGRYASGLPEPGG